MEELLNLLKDGNSRSVELLALELNTTTDDIRRRMEFLERADLIRRVLNSGSCCPTVGAGKADAGSGTCGVSWCADCSGCVMHTKGKKPGKKSPCSGCLPKEGFKNMGEMWEVVK